MEISNAYCSVVAPGDLIIFSTVLIASAASIGLTTFPELLQISGNGSKSTLKKEKLEPFVRIVIVTVFVCGLMLIAFLFAYCIVKVTVMSIEHENHQLMSHQTTALQDFDRQDDPTPLKVNHATVIPIAYLHESERTTYAANTKPTSDSVNSEVASSNANRLILCALISTILCLASIIVAGAIRHVFFEYKEALLESENG
jgi:cell division protein FtsL